MDSDRKNVSKDISWLDRDIKRWREVGTLIPTNQLKVYQKLRDIATGLTIIDIGCSIGVGANILSHTARHVWGIDVNEEAIKFANDTFARPNLGFNTFNIENLGPRERAKFDMVLMAEVIEHLEDFDTALNNMKTFFHEKSIGYITTPNKNNPDLAKDGLPNNELHVREWTSGEFYDLMTKHFEHVVLYSIPKLDIWSMDETIDGSSQDTPMIAKVEGPK